MQARRLQTQWDIHAKNMDIHAKNMEDWRKDKEDWRKAKEDCRMRRDGKTDVPVSLSGWRMGIEVAWELLFLPPSTMYG